MVEHHNGIVGVRGSNPLGSTISFSPENNRDAFAFGKTPGGGHVRCLRHAGGDLTFGEGKAVVIL